MCTHQVLTFLFTASICAAALIGCASDSAITPVTREPSLARVAINSVPISGTCTTAFAPPTFPPPPVIRQVDVGTCELSHLGRTSIYSVEEIDIAAGTQRSIEFTYTAANGDVLRVVNVGTNTPNGAGVRFSATTSFVGGTGRFANARGEAHVEGTASFLTNTASYTLDGWIAYD